MPLTLKRRIVDPALDQITVAIAKTEIPKQPWEMFGEYLRELAVLVVVFVPIDLLIPQLRGDQHLDRARLVRLLATIAVGLFFLSMGMLAERRKR